MLEFDIYQLILKKISDQIYFKTVFNACVKKTLIIFLSGLLSSALTKPTFSFFLPRIFWGGGLLPKVIMEEERRADLLPPGTEEHG